MSLDIDHILLVGCGKMGGAMLRSWIKDSAINHITVIDPNNIPAEFIESPKVTHHKKTNIPRSNIDAVILAVKPQILDQTGKNLAQTITHDTLLISIAAGKTIASIAKIFSKKQPIIRTMPNTPAAIGKGTTAICANEYVSKHQKNMVQTLLSATGVTETIEDETLFNAITALSGSGPAYLFHMIEILEKAGTEIGLPPDLSQRLARQTIIGSAALAAAEPETPPDILRQNVTSPGGTTEAALNILMNGDIQDIYNKALQSAKKRGEELNASETQKPDTKT